MPGCDEKKVNRYGKKNTHQIKKSQRKKNTIYQREPAQKTKNETLPLNTEINLAQMLQKSKQIMHHI